MPKSNLAQWQPPRNAVANIDTLIELDPSYETNMCATLAAVITDQPSYECIVRTYALYAYLCAKLKAENDSLRAQVERSYSI